MGGNPQGHLAGNSSRGMRETPTKNMVALISLRCICAEKKKCLVAEQLVSGAPKAPKFHGSPLRERALVLHVSTLHETSTFLHLPLKKAAKMTSSHFQ